jgi:hypothetical protein|tara:strand:- start:2718 stop:2888 length:171 start_codon:yes stop_codon:yes gene_type:complete
MKDLDKKSNTQLSELKFKLAQDFYLAKKETLLKYDHLQKIKEVYGIVLQELKNRNL